MCTLVLEARWRLFWLTWRPSGVMSFKNTWTYLSKTWRYKKRHQCQCWQSVAQSVERWNIVKKMTEKLNVTFFSITDASCWCRIFTTGNTSKKLSTCCYLIWASQVHLSSQVFIIELYLGLVWGSIIFFCLFLRLTSASFHTQRSLCTKSRCVRHLAVGWAVLALWMLGTRRQVSAVSKMVCPTGTPGGLMCH